MNSYQLAMLGNVLLTALAAGLIFGPFDLFDDSDDDTGEADQDQDVYLGESDDAFIGADAIDTVFGEGGDDTISGAGGDDLLFGGDGNDIVSGDAGNDVVEGNLGDDVLQGGDGDDLLTGGSGTDVINGGAGNDVISSDRLDSDAEFSRGEQERLSGGDGDDRIVMSTGDVASGGEGQDAFDLVVVDGEDSAVIDDFDADTESLSIYYNPDDFGGGAPDVTVSVDADTGKSDVLLDGQSVLTLNGVDSLAAEDVTLLTEDVLTA